MSTATPATQLLGGVKGRASRREHVSQSGVSAQIKQLERELGSPLLDRAGRTVTLTDLGEAVLSHARAALRAIRSEEHV